jgi:hypothetical protein
MEVPGGFLAFRAACDKSDGNIVLKGMTAHCQGGRKKLHPAILPPCLPGTAGVETQAAACLATH